MLIAVTRAVSVTLADCELTLRPRDPINVDLTTFHSAEVPKGSGMNYTDGITPFVIGRINSEGRTQYIMETGYRERQAGSSTHSPHDMRFEPRRGYFQEDPNINRALSPAVSGDPRTWPETWPDKAEDPADPGWNGSWNGYFGKRPAADEESFFVMDDQYYDSFGFQPDMAATFSITARARASFICASRNATGSAFASAASSSMKDSEANTLA